MTPAWYQASSDWSKDCMPYCTDPSAIRSGMLSCLDRSRMLSWTAAVLIRISDAGMRPRPSLRGTRRSDTTAERAVDKRRRTSSCWCGGEEKINPVDRLGGCLVLRLGETLLAMWA